MTQSTGGLMRASHVWLGEVMADAVLREPGSITLGDTGKATFTTPRFGLPAKFEILRPGARGYVLTLGAGMRGTVCLGGEELRVEDFLARGGGERAEGTAGNFRATPVAPGDWGVIALDADGDHELFFQFVPDDDKLPPEAAFRDAEELLPALGFASALIAVFLIGVYGLFPADGKHSLVFPGDADLIADYLVARPPPVVEADPEEVKAGAEDGETEAPAASSAGESGKSGGEGDKPRARAPDPDLGSAEDPVVAKVNNTGLLRHKDSFASVSKRGGFDKKLGNAMARMRGPRNDGGPGGYGPGKGTGVGPGEGTGTTRGGDGKGPGGGGTAHGDVVTTGVIKTGGTRVPKGSPGGKGVKEATVSVKTGTPDGDFNGLSRDEVVKRVKSRANAIRFCYERQLQRNPTLSGKVEVYWKITPAGAVTSAKIKSSTLRNGDVEDCVLRQVQKIPFPKSEGSTTVVFPFIFDKS